MEVVHFSVIHIIDFEVDLSEFERPRKRFGLKDGVLYPLSTRDNYDGYDEQFSEQYAQVIEQFQEKWLPAPVFRSAGTANFDQGHQLGQECGQKLNHEMKMVSLLK